jgi:hypothetical protein
MHELYDNKSINIKINTINTICFKWQHRLSVLNL